jgi:hypothetical protein
MDCPNSFDSDLGVDQSIQSACKQGTNSGVCICDHGASDWGGGLFKGGTAVASSASNLQSRVNGIVCAGLCHGHWDWPKGDI